jgi:UDP-glucose 4-epimerase
MNQTILVTGATGAVGPCVVNALHQAGCQVLTFSVDAPKEGMFPRNVEVLLGDIIDKIAVHSAMQGVDGVIHLAAILHIVNPPPEMREKYERVNVGGTAMVIEAAIKAGVKRVVLFSTIDVYGPSNGCVFNEKSKTHPVTFYAQTKLAAEQIVLNAIGAGGQSLGTVLRLGTVYGPRIKGNYERLINALTHNHFIPIGNGLNRRTLIYDKDVGRAAAQAFSNPIAAGRLFNVTDGGFHTMNEIIESICAVLDRKPPRISLPLSVSYQIADLIGKTARVTGLRLPAIRSMIGKYTEDIAVDGSLFQTEIGFVPQYDLKSGWAETIREMRAWKEYLI